MSEEKRTIADEVEEDEKIQEVKEEFNEPDTVKLRINRVPKKVSDKLKTEAQEEWGGDYGMALTYWFKEKQALESAHARIANLEARMAKLETRLTEALNKDDEENNDSGLERING